MSEPTTFQFAVIYVEDPDTPNSFHKLCGVQTSGFNRAVQTTDRYARDCDKPGKPAERRLRVTGLSRTLTGSGVYNTDLTDLFEVLPGKRRNYRFQMLDLSDPDDEAGTSLGMWAGPGVCTTLNIGGEDNQDGSLSITVESDGAWTFTAPAP
jgi:hypothetical protein